MLAKTRMRFLLLAALTAASVVFWTLRMPPPVPTSDAADYVALAQNLRLHGIFGYGAPPRPTNLREPGYSAFLALVFMVVGGPSTVGLVVAQAMLLAGTAWFTMLIVQRLAPEKRLLPWIVALAVALNPIFAQYTGLFLGEVLQAFLLALALWAAIEAFERDSVSFAVLSGIAWAALVMTRLTWLFFPFVLAALAFFRAKDRRIPVALALITLMAVGGWAWRNHLELGTWMVAGRGGGESYVRAVKATYDPAARAAYWHATFLGFAFERGGHDQVYSYNEIDGWDDYWHLQDKFVAEGRSPDEIEREFLALTRAAITQHPLRWFIDGFAELWKLLNPMTFNGPTINTFAAQVSSPNWPIFAALLIAFRFLTLAAIIIMIRGGWLAWHSGFGGKILVLAVAYHAAVHFFFDAIPRYAIPAWPVLLFFFVLACYDGTRYVSLFRRHSRIQ